MPPRHPISPSTVTPLAWAISTTSRVASTLYSKVDGVLPSGISEPSIITLVKPMSMALLQVSTLLPWSRCRTVGNLGVELRGGEHQVIQEPVLRIGARAAAGLHDHRRLGFARRFHDRLNLFHVVDVERANAISAFGCLIEKLPHRY